MTQTQPNAARGVRLAGTGAAVPDRVLTNHDLAQIVDTSDEWIRQRSGISERRIIAEGQGVLDLAKPALRQALENSGVTPSELDLVICATITNEMACPSTAARLVADTGAEPAGAMDLSAACSGFVYGINIADSLIRTGAMRTIAVLGCETLSTLTNWQDRGTCVLFGDAAAAAVFCADDDPARGCIHQTMHSQGSKWNQLYCPRLPRDVPAEGAEFTGAFNTLHMNGREIYKFAVATLGRSIQKALAAVGLAPSDLAMVVAHQSNARILESAREKLGLCEDKLYINIDRYGNTSAASIPLCLHELMDQGRLSPGDLVCFVGVGGGLTWATSLWRL